MATLTASITETAVATSAAGLNASIGIIIPTDHVIARSLSSYHYAAGAAVTDRVEASSAFMPQTICHYALSSNAVVRDHVFTQLTAYLADAAKVSSSIAAAYACQLLDRLTVTAKLGVGAIYSTALIEHVTATSSISPQLGVALVDLVKAFDSPQAQWATLRAITDLVEIDDAAGAQRLVIVAIDDGVNVADMNAVEAIYHLSMTDCVMAIGSAEPEGGLTAWAINARSGGVTEYRDWPFNSYVFFGDRYVGASDDGIFELVGDADQTTPIIARIAGGRMQLTGSYLTGLDGVYLAVNGEGRMFLKLDGAKGETVYEVTTSSEHTARINVGQGWRSRYISWELISTGQDFDLEGLEFEPIASQRRTGG